MLDISGRCHPSFTVIFDSCCAEHCLCWPAGALQGSTPELKLAAATKSIIAHAVDAVPGHALSH